MKSEKRQFVLLITLCFLFITVVFALLVNRIFTSITFYENNVSIAAQPGLNFVSSTDIRFELTNDPNNERVQVEGFLGNSIYSEIVENILTIPGWSLINMSDINTQSLAGSGSTGVSWNSIGASTGATAASTAIRRAGGSDKGLSQGKPSNVLNWDSNVFLYLNFMVEDTTTNGIGTITFGKNSSNIIGDLTNKGIGIRTDNLALKGITHNGSILTVVDLGITLTEDYPYRLFIESLGDGNVNWYSVTYVNGIKTLTQLGTTVNGPTGDSSVGYQLPQVDAQNGADSADYDIHLHEIRLMVGE